MTSTDSKMSTRILFITIAFFFTLSINGQANRDSLLLLPLDSLTSWLEQNVETPDSTGLCETALKQAMERKDTLLEIRLRENIYDRSIENAAAVGFQSIINNYKPVLTLYKETNQLSRYGDRLCNMSDLYLNLGKNDSSQVMIFEAIEIYKTLGDEEGEGLALHSLSNLTCNIEEYEKSNEYAEQAIALLTKTGDYSRAALCHMTMARSYIALEDYKSALASADSGLLICKEHELKRHAVIESVLLGVRGDAYLEMGDYDKALADYEKEGETNEINLLYNRGNIHRLRKEYRAAIPYLEEYIGIYIEHYDDMEMLMEYEKIIECYEKVGEYDKAYEYLSRYQNGKSTEYDTKISTLESELLQKYEAGKKDEAILSQSVLINQKSKNQRVLTFFLIALALSLMSLFFLYKKNRTFLSQLSIKNAQNETLLKEIHHRVKNNLQTISSLLYLQSVNISDQDAREAITKGQSRVESMALIHKNLYQRGNLAGIEMNDYLSRLVASLKNSFLDSAQDVDITLEVNEEIVDVDTAIPLGLIINELLTNIFKYAFPNNRRGKVKIVLESKEEGNEFYMRIEDNGIGNVESSDGFGTKLIALLTKQLGATFRDGNDNGYWSEIRKT